MSEQNTEEWWVIVDTDSYSGNFEREMASYITGYPQTRGEKLVKDIQSHYGFNPKVYGSEWEDHPQNPWAGLLEYSDGEYGPELAHICPTPGYGNDGHGGSKKLTGGPEDKYYPYPSYQSVHMLYTERLSNEQLGLLKEWAEKFVALKTRSGPSEILGVRLVKRTASYMTEASI